MKKQLNTSWIICENNTIAPSIVIFELEKEALYTAIRALESWDKYSGELWKEAYDRGFKDGVKEGIKAME